MGWDPRQAAFWLIAAVVAVHALVVLAGVGMCLIYAREIVAGKFTCDAQDKLGGLLANAMAAAIALWAAGKEK